jgi:hypothetical protein
MGQVVELEQLAVEVVQEVEVLEMQLLDWVLVMVPRH